MTIKEIAQLAGVSVSTVSKIMNNKDDNISAKTREHVLQIAKEYSYTPYASVITPLTKTLTIGVIVRDTANVHLALASILETANRHGYSLLLRGSGGNPETELKNISAMVAAHVDGVLWEPVSAESLDYSEQLDRVEIPYLTVNCIHESSLNLDYRRMGYLAAQALVSRRHTEIACLIHHGDRSEAFFQGYRECLFENHLPFQQDLVFSDVDSIPVSRIASHLFSGIVVSHYTEALKLYQTIDTLHYAIPYDLSIVSLKADSTPTAGYPIISTLTIPYTEFGTRITEALIQKIEKQEARPQGEIDFQLDNETSIDIPYSSRKKKILSIGSINIDNYLTFETLPRTGKTVTSSDSSTYLGGKCMNEAIGAAKLGHSVSVIGGVGNDADSDTIYRSAKEFGISAVGIRRCSDCKTGQAYIFVQKNGDSMISILSGANSMVGPEDIENNERLFAGAGYCLIQTEIPLPAVIRAGEMAKKHHLVTVLKPSSCSGLPDALLKNIDIMIPNLDELNELCPGGSSMEEKAESLRKKGVQTVIVTLGASGCYIHTGEISCYIPAADFTAVDNTGAGDAFISALVSYLLYDYDIVSAAKIASYAAGFSITRQGVTPALIDKSTLEAYLRVNEPELLKE